MATRLRWSDLPLRVKGLIVIGIPLASLLVSGGVTLSVLRQASEAERALHQAHSAQLTLGRLRLLIVDAEAGVRGYLLTGREDFLRFYQEAVLELPATLSDAKSRLNAEPNQLAQLERAEAQIEQQLLAFQTWLAYVDILSSPDPTLSDNFMVTSQVVMDAVSLQLSELQQAQESIMAKRELALSRVQRRFSLAIGINIMFGLLGGVMAALLFAQGVSRRIAHLQANAGRLAFGEPLFPLPSAGDEIGRLGRSLDEASLLLQEREQDLRKAHAQLSEQLSELSRHNERVVLLSELGETLQASATVQECCDIFLTSVGGLLPGSSGKLYLFGQDGQLQLRSAWPEADEQHPYLKLSDCKATVGEARYGFRGEACEHLPDWAEMSFCLPVMMQESMLGILQIYGVEPIGDGLQTIVKSMVDRLALALSNLRLRETLLRQSTRDPLTGLYNRRYLEEALERELEKAKREAYGLGVVMFDIDHFKAFNDSYGHIAGDALLREVSQLLRSVSRKGDIPCRFGGEEFVLILPNADLQTTLKRAREWHRQIRDLHIRYDDRTLRPVTISVGVAAYPEHSDRADSLLAKADTALYLSKQGGRDQVSVV